MAAWRVLVRTPVQQHGGNARVFDPLHYALVHFGAFCRHFHRRKEYAGDPARQTLIAKLYYLFFLARITRFRMGPQKRVSARIWARGDGVADRFEDLRLAQVRNDQSE